MPKWISQSQLQPIPRCWRWRIDAKMADKKLIATTVSSREKGIRRREEGETTSSQRTFSSQWNQEERRNNFMKDDDETPTHMINRRSNNDDATKRMEDLRGKGGGRLKHCTVDGEKESGSSTQSKTQHCVMNKMASGSGDICPSSIEKKDVHPETRKWLSLFFKKHEVNALKWKKSQNW